MTAHRYEPGTCPQCEASREALADHQRAIGDLRAERDRLRAALSDAHDSAERLARALVDVRNPRLRG